MTFAIWAIVLGLFYAVSRGGRRVGAGGRCTAASRSDQRFDLTVENDLIILDVMLPERDGWSILAALRKAGKQTPVLFLTARDTVYDKVKGLELGADDYLVKPFDFSELLARVRTILRRGPARQADILRVADLQLDLPRRKAIRAGVRIQREEQFGNPVRAIRIS